MRPAVRMCGYLLPPFRDGHNYGEASDATAALDFADELTDVQGDGEG